MTGSIFRRQLFRRAGTLLAAAPLSGLFPERDLTDQHTYRPVFLADPEAAALTRRVHASPLWRALQGDVVSTVPSGIARDRSGTARFVAFDAWDRSPAAVAQRERGPFQLLDGLLFALDADTVVDAVRLSPDLDHRTSLARWIVDGRVESIQHKVELDELVRRRDDAITRKQQLAPTRTKPKAGALALYGQCDCGFNSMWYCSSQLTVPGHWDTNCLVACGFISNTPLRAACTAGCWVWGYTTCTAYACKTCVF